MITIHSDHLKLCVSYVSSGATGIDCSSPIPICPPLPYTNNGLTTAGSINNFNGDSNLCQSPYMTGQDYIFTYTPAATQCVTISINGTGANSFPGLFLLDGCPNDTDNSTCVASAINTSNEILSVILHWQGDNNIISSSIITTLTLVLILFHLTFK